MRDILRGVFELINARNSAAKGAQHERGKFFGNQRGIDIAQDAQQL
jgi:hypothetical protein